MEMRLLAEAKEKALLGLVLCLELLVKALDEVVGNVIMEALHTDTLNTLQRFNGHLVGKVAIAYNGLRSPHRLHGFQYGKRLRAVPVAIQMEAKNKASLAVQNKPEVVFLTLYLYYGFIGMSFIRVEIERRNELYGNVLEHWDEAGTPVADGGVGHLDIHHGPRDQSNVAKGVLAQVEHGQGHENHMDRIVHSLEIRLSKEFGHRRSRNGSRLWYE